MALESTPQTQLQMRETRGANKENITVSFWLNQAHNKEKKPYSTIRILTGHVYWSSRCSSTIRAIIISWNIKKGRTPKNHFYPEWPAPLLRRPSCSWSFQIWRVSSSLSWLWANLAAPSQDLAIYHNSVQVNKEGCAMTQFRFGSWAVSCRCRLAGVEPSMGKL